MPSVLLRAWLPERRAGVDMWESAAVDLPHSDVDPGGLLEYSVVFTDRSLNHMSKRFVAVMQDIVDVLCTTYRAETVAVVPGGGTYAMEAVARQLATGRRCLVVRNGLFSYRWSQIFDAGSIPSQTTLCCAAPVSDGWQAPWAPPRRCPMDGRPKGPPRRSRRWSRLSSAPIPRSSSRHTSRRRRGYCYRTATSAPSPRPPMMSVGFSSSTASRRGRSGWT